MRRAWPAMVLVALAATACSAPGIQSTLDPAGDQAAGIHGIWLLMLAVCGLMYALVLGFLGWALLRHRRRPGAAPAEPVGDVQDPGLQTATAVWTGVIVAGILLLTTASFLVDRGLAQTGPQPLKVKVTAKQWWWAVEYQDPADPSRTLTTANELHLPLGRPAQIELQAQDVIHSFWVPNLHGKEDLIPGRTNNIVLTPRRTGVFRGQCAEFCGLQHAHMALDVTVDSPEAFKAWYDAGLKPAPEPVSTSQLLGRQVFLGKACALCHQISGTSAASHAGPDLTHVASRKSLAAGTLPYSKGDLAGWINDPQSFKPGSNMPAVPMTGEELAQLVDYLDSLK